MEVPASRPTYSTGEPCAHCGLPVGPRPIEEAGEAFCCSACALVRGALRDAGYAETVDRLRPLANSGSTRPVAPDPLGVRELDTERFLDEHTALLDGGLREADLVLDGVHCAACVWVVERLPYEIDGVTEARLDLPRGRVRLAFDPDRVALSSVADWLARFGYALRPTRGERQSGRSEAEHRLLVRTGVAWALAGNVMLLAFALYSGLDEAGGPFAAAARWASLALAIPAVAYGGAPFFRRAWASLGLAWRAKDPRRLHLDTPIALGVLVGFGHSAWATVSGAGDVWFDSVTVLIAALLTARYVQLRSRRLAGDASERLLALLPAMARRRTRGGTEAVRLDELVPGDVVEVSAGEAVPVDGTVEEGESRVDNAVLTGESRPIPVAPGATVAAGATNLTAPLLVRVEAAGEASRVGRLLAWVREAETGRAPVVLWADKLGGVFVLAVMTLAVLTAATWLVLDPSRLGLHVAALLVITCPCALGMATPLAFAVAAGRAARGGIFVKSDRATQALTTIDTVVLDKTGTLTEGAMTLVAEVADMEALELVAALESCVAHPIASAVVRAVPDPRGEVSRVEAVNGAGVRGTVDDREVLVGRPDWIVREIGAPLSHRLAAFVDETAEAGHTPVGVAVDGAWRGLLAIGDATRTDAHDLIDTLREEGKAVLVLSGDHPETVARLARSLGIPEMDARGGVAPEAKQRIVAGLQAQGRRVMVVGDGVNDAAALRQADVGVAVGGGSTASLVAADVFLTRPGLAPVLRAMATGRTAVRTVRRALTVSLAYNALGAAAAMAGLVTPLVAAIAMPVSSLLVVTIALTQRAPDTRRPTRSETVRALSGPPGLPHASRVTHHAS